MESAKFRALRTKNLLKNQRAYILTYQRVLHAYVITCLACSRANVSFVLTCLRANVLCVLTSQSALYRYMCSRANVPYTAYIYDANFIGNVLIVGRTGCGKTYLTQIAVNKFFGKLKRVEWASYIDLGKGREAEI